jgi:hypothetical protein
MNLPSTTLASNPVARSSIARTSTSVTPRCSMRNSAWPVNERSQFHHSWNVGIEPRPEPTGVCAYARLGIDVTRLAHQSGVRLLAGTDLLIEEGASFPTIHEEMELLVRRAGLTPSQRRRRSSSQLPVD